MNITDGAKGLLEDIFTNNGCDCLVVSFQPGGCSGTLRFELAVMEPDQSPLLINGIPIFITDEAVDKAQGVTLDERAGELVVTREGSACGGCSGCN